MTKPNIAANKATTNMSPAAKEVLQNSRDEFHRWYAALKNFAPFYPRAENYLLLRSKQ